MLQELGVVPTLEVLPKTVGNKQNRGIGMLKFGCILPNAANACLQSSSSVKLYPLTDCDEDLVSKVREDLIKGTSKKFTFRAVADRTHICKYTNVCGMICGNR